MAGVFVAMRDNVRGRRMLAGFFLLVSGLIAALAGWIPLIQFVAENIRISVQPDRVAVEGVYLYRNPWPVPIVQGMSVPLPLDADHPCPIGLRVEQLEREPREVPLRYLWGRHRFDLRVPAKGTARLRVAYRQYCPEGKARYILTTTQPWLRPLEHGSYELRLLGVSLDRCNYALQPIATNRLEFTRTRFMPEADWEFAWTKIP